MSWGGFSIALLLVYIVQTGSAPIMPFESFDAFMVFALLLGAILPTPDARIGAWIAGFAQDLGSLDALGVHAFTLGLTAIAITWLRTLVNVSVWWVRILACGVAAWIGQAVYLTHLHLWTRQGGGALDIIAGATWTALVCGILAGLIAGLPGLMHRRRTETRPYRRSA